MYISSACGSSECVPEEEFVSLYMAERPKFTYSSRRQRKNETVMLGVCVCQQWSPNNGASRESWHTIMGIQEGQWEDLPEQWLSGPN